MTGSRTAWALTLVNLVVLVAQVVQVVRVGDAWAKEEPPLLRGRGLEIVDGAGRVRMQVKVEPADPAYRWPDGSRVGYPETVILRLATADGKPRVKLTTSEQGSSLMLLGDSDTTQTVLHAEGAKASLLLRNDEATRKVLAP